MPGGPPSTIDLAGKTIEEFCDLTLAGNMYPAICDLWGVTAWSLLRWLNKDPQRAARAKEARAWAAEFADAKAEWLINSAEDNFSLAKAREQAHHQRWRARQLARNTYADHSGQIPTEAAETKIIVENGIETSYPEESTPSAAENPIAE